MMAYPIRSCHRYGNAGWRILHLQFIFFKFKGDVTNNNKNSYKISRKSKSNHPSATQDETVDWKAYSNSKMGFSIKYPNNWRYSITSSILIYFYSEADAKVGLVEVLKQGEDNSNLTEEYTNLSSEKIGKVRTLVKGSTATRLENTSVDKLLALKDLINRNVPGGEGSSPKYNLHVYVKNNNDYWDITLGANNKTILENSEKTFDLMLSTFKFLD